MQAPATAPGDEGCHALKRTWSAFPKCNHGIMPIGMLPDEPAIEVELLIMDGFIELELFIEGSIFLDRSRRIVKG